MRVIVRDDTVENDGTFKTHNVLAVLRTRARQASLVSVIDEAENADAISIARRIADSEAPPFALSKDRPGIAGQPSICARRVLGEPAH